jgi:hypothetical protein
MATECRPRRSSAASATLNMINVFLVPVQRRDRLLGPEQGPNGLGGALGEAE